MDKEIIEQFEEFGFEAPKDEILDKCVELCHEYNLGAADFVDQWIAFTLSNLNGAEPTIAHLKDLERKELKSKLDKKHNTSIKIGTPTASTSKQQRSIYECNTPADNEIIEEYDEVMGAYCKTPKIQKERILRTPVQRNGSPFNSPISSPFSGTPRTSKYNGKIVYTYGNSNLVQQYGWSFKVQENIQIKEILLYNNESMNIKCKYMLDCLNDKTIIGYDKLFDIGKELCQKVFGKNDKNTYDLQNANMPSHETIKTIGRISYDYDENKLTKSSIVLVGLSINDDLDDDDERPNVAYLDMSNLKSYSIFPGQIAMVIGKNLTGRQIVVENIFTEINISTPIPPILKEFNTELRFVIASGPFTHHDDLIYEPLQDLISYCKDNRPNVIILFGPFMDDEHSMIKDNPLTESFESFFEKIISGIIEQIGEETKICIVSSQKDVTSTCVYPTHPLITRKNYPNVHMLPDPCIIEINGLTIGATSTDIFKHLVEEELILNAGDKVKRIVNYLLHQGTFYPLEPSTSEVCMDSDLASKYAKLDMVPNILILPSDQKYFIRDVNKCLVINPGRVVDINDGTFARLIVSPSTAEEVNTSNYTFGQIMKI